MRTPFIAGNWKMNKTAVDAVTFVNAAGEDLQLDSADTGAKGLGTDLSGTFTDDIDFDTITTWSCGPDAQVAAGGSGPAAGLRTMTLTGAGV